MDSMAARRPNSTATPDTWPGIQRLCISTGMRSGLCLQKVQRSERHTRTHARRPAAPPADVRGAAAPARGAPRPTRESVSVRGQSSQSRDVYFPRPIFIAFDLIHGPVCHPVCGAAGVKAISPHVTRVHVAYVQVSSIDETQPKQGFVNSPTSRGWFHWLARGKPHSRAHPTPMSL